MLKGLGYDTLVPLLYLAISDQDISYFGTILALIRHAYLTGRFNWPASLVAV